jgi:hypothetical protein
MKNGKLNFTIGFDGECEEVEVFEVDGINNTDNVNYSDVDRFVEELLVRESIMVSEHRTEVEVTWIDGKMNVHFRYFNEPEDGEFDDFKFDGLEPIEFVIENEVE